LNKDVLRKRERERKKNETTHKHNYKRIQKTDEVSKFGEGGKNRRKDTFF